MILNLAVTPDDKPSTAHLAAVCRDWQTIVERTTFSRLTITPQKLPDLENILRTNRRRQNVRYIWLCIELPDYTCSDCMDTESDECQDQNREIINNTMRGLFMGLSTWEKPGRGGLQLDISVHSPSDTEHHFKYIRFSPDRIPAHQDDDKSAMVISDPPHDWEDNAPTSLPPHWSIKRLFSHNELDPDLLKRLPTIPAVTNLTFRRQTRRRWDPEHLGQLIQLFPHLKELCYEPWREWTHRSQTYTDIDYLSLLDSLTQNNNLDKMALFEDSNEDYMRSFRYSSDQSSPRRHTARVRVSPRDVNESLAQASLNLVQLSASFIADAAHFFKACQPEWVWGRLTSLSLTTPVMAPPPKCSPSAINKLLGQAAGVAANMPALNTLELWNGGVRGKRGFAAVFRYQYLEHGEGRLPAVITWRGTFGVRLEEDVVQAWKDVAFRRRGERDGEFRAVMDPISRVDRRRIKSHGDAVYQLGLVNEVARPVSVWQVRRENAKGFWNGGGEGWK